MVLELKYDIKMYNLFFYKDNVSPNLTRNMI